VGRRGLAVLWFALGVALWNGVFDLYVSRGAREYLQLRAESELGLAPSPSMSEVMDRAQRMGAVAASLWAGAIVACGWVTVLLAGRSARAAPPPPASDLNRGGASSV
jgi:hypothetical protein